MNKFLLPFKQSRLLNTLFLANVFISFHYALIIYLNSSYLSNFFSETQVSSLYIIGSIIDTFLLLNASKLLEKIGSYRFVMYGICIEFMATLGLSLFTSPILIAVCFLTHLLTISLLLFNMDVLVEDVSTDESTTGSVRATYLTMTNITVVLAPIFISLFLIGNNYSPVYLLSSLAILPLYFFIHRFKRVEIEPIHHIKVKETILEYIKNRDLYNIFICQFLLQLFYAYMVIYTPMYLRDYIGFSWTQIGLIFTLMLLPFVIFEVPVGEMADNKYGEKEFLTIGFIVMGLATLFISFITAQVLFIWAAVLFITRIGASFVEVSTESYFFKQVNQSKTDVISFFRVTRPISFIVAPILATISLQFIPFQYMFIVIGTLMIVGSHYSLALHDTR